MSTATATKEKTNVASVCFKISGDFITETCRNLVKEGSWRQAYDLLVEDLHGMSSDVALDILAGKRKLVGINDLDLEDEDPKDVVKYLKDIDFIFGSVIKHKDLYYRPDREIISWGEKDYYFAAERAPIGGEDRRKWTLDNRSQYYANDGEIAITIFPNEKHKQRAIIFAPVADIPMFIKPKKTPEEAVEQAERVGRLLLKDGHQCRFGSVDEKYNETIPVLSTDELERNEKIRLTGEVRDELDKAEKKSTSSKAANLTDNDEEEYERQERLWNEKISRYRDLIVEQANNGAGWVDLYVKELDRTYSVAKAPLLQWIAHMTLMGKHLKKAGVKVPDWDPISESGLKMFNDDRYHTDWFISAGFDPGDAYDSFCNDNNEGKLLNDAAYSFMYALVDENLNVSAVPLVRNGKATGKLVFPNPNEGVEPGSIIVIPTAGPEYDLAARTAHVNGGGAIITETGGKLCHLATVGRENNYRMVMVENALMSYQQGMTVEVDTENGTVTYLDVEFNGDKK